MIIVVANSKGGVGKSTLAVHLAAWLLAQGRTVTFADCDAQHSSSQWVAEALPAARLVRLETSNDIINDLPHLAAEADYVVADGPGSDADRGRALLFRADLAVVPCKASMLEARALAAATDVLRQVQDVRGGPPPAVVVLSMVGKQYLLTKDMKDAAATLKLQVAANALTLRQVYADAPGQRAVVAGLGRRGWEAADEVDRLCRELLPEAVATTSARSSATWERPKRKAKAAVTAAAET